MKYNFAGVGHALIDKYQGKVVPYETVATLMGIDPEDKDFNMTNIKTGLNKVLKEEKFILKTVRGEGFEVSQLQTADIVHQKAPAASTPPKRTKKASGTKKKAAEPVGVDLDYLITEAVKDQKSFGLLHELADALGLKVIIRLEKV